MIIIIIKQINEFFYNLFKKLFLFNGKLINIVYISYFIV